MALSPKLIIQIPWDATLSHNFEFTYTGNQVYANRLIIKNNITNVTVCDTKTTSFQMYAPIISNLLSNGITYNAQLSVFDINDVESPLSQTIIFQCLSTPIVTFTNLVANQIIRNSNYNFTFSYTQANGELLNEYQIFLYDSNKNQLSTTGILYANASSSLGGTLSGFSDNTQYYARITGSTVNAVSIDSGYVIFSVDYIAPENWSKLVLENTDDGMIKISSNVTLITGTVSPTPAIYVNDTKIDLTANGSKVYFDKDFNIANIVGFKILGQKFIPYSTIAEFSNGVNKIEVKYMLGTFTVGENQQAYFVLNAYNSYACSRICSTPMAVPSDSQEICISVKRVSNIFDLSVTLE